MRRLLSACTAYLLALLLALQAEPAALAVSSKAARQLPKLNLPAAWRHRDPDEHRRPCSGAYDCSDGYMDAQLPIARRRAATEVTDGAGLQARSAFATPYERPAHSSLQQWQQRELAATAVEGSLRQSTFPGKSSIPLPSLPSGLRDTMKIMVPPQSAAPPLNPGEPACYPV